MDKIHIRDIETRCIIGINKDERDHKQDVIINVTLYTDLTLPGETDLIEDTVNYKVVKKNIIRMVESSSFGLLEKLATRIAAIALDDSRVKRVDVCVDKPGALRYASSAAVEITREQP